MDKSINEIKKQFENITIGEIKKLIIFYEKDSRAGVQNILKNYAKKIEKYKNELIRIEKMKIYENEAYSMGKGVILGIDEVGRGCLAGPVVTAGVVLPKNAKILYVNDSKKLSGKKREILFEEIQKIATEISINFEDNDVIDNINILQATKKSMLENIKKLKNAPDYLILDNIKLDIDIPYISVPKADERSISVACASIIAKVTRDNFMKKMHNIYPNYNFIKNKGYGVPEHIEAIKKYGICKIHRKTFVQNI